MFRMTIYLLFLSAIILSCNDNGVKSNNETTIQNIIFNQITSSSPDTIKTLESLKKEGDLFMMTYYGNYFERLEELNERIIKYGISSVIPPPGSVNNNCSIFSAAGNSSRSLLGRNLDNNAPRGVLIGHYSPPDGYSSIAVSNMYHLGFARGEDPTTLPIAERLHLLNSVLFSDDGVNERGVSIALASVDAQQIQRDENKKLVNISYLMREVLDHAGNTEEAIEIISNRDVFDQNVSTISHHFLISDQSGASAVTEYSGGEWHIIRTDRNWQIATNTVIYNVSEEWKRNECNRYRTADNYLNETNGQVTWQQGMEVLNRVSVYETQWSSLYDLSERRMYITLYRNYDQIFSIDL